MGPGQGGVWQFGTYLFMGVNIFVMKHDRGGRGGSEKVKISMTSFMNGP